MDFISKKSCRAENDVKMLLFCMCGAAPCLKAGAEQLKCAEKKIKQIKKDGLKKGN